MGIKSLNEELCNGCNICIRDCPMDVIRMDEKIRKAYIAYGKDCDVCYICQLSCPEKAIEVSPEASKLPVIVPY